MVADPNRRAGRRDRAFTGDAVEEPSWVIPLAVVLAVGLLSLAFLAYYLAPSLSEILGRAPKPSYEAAPVQVVIGGVRHEIPASYTRFAYARRGGIQDRMELYALLPGLEPYDPTRASAFQDNSADSRVVFFEIEAATPLLSERDRFRKVYRQLVTDPKGRRGPYGLRRYEFDETSGFRDEDLFVREEDGEVTLVLRCLKDLPDIVSPSCRRDVEFGAGLVLHYRFKRAHLDAWRDIDDGVRNLARSFQVGPRPD